MYAHPRFKICVCFFEILFCYLVGGFCEPEQIGEYYWPETVVGDVAELPCFNGSAIRLCIGASEWGPPLTDQCDDGIGMSEGWKE